MKHKDFKPCCICGKGIGHEGHFLFLKVRVERFGLDAGALRRAHGLEQMMGGNAVLANVMGPNEDLAKRVDDSGELLICHGCSERPLPPYFWMRDEEEAPESKGGSE